MPWPTTTPIHRVLHPVTIEADITGLPRQVHDSSSQKANATLPSRPQRRVINPRRTLTCPRNVLACDTACYRGVVEVTFRLHCIPQTSVRRDSSSCCLRIRAKPLGSHNERPLDVVAREVPPSMQELIVHHPCEHHAAWRSVSVEDAFPPPTCIRLLQASGDSLHSLRHECTKLTSTPAVGIDFMGWPASFSALQLHKVVPQLKHGIDKNDDTVHGTRKLRVVTGETLCEQRKY